MLVSIPRRIFCRSLSIFRVAFYVCFVVKYRGSAFIVTSFGLTTGRRKVSDTESVRQGNWSTNSGVVRLGFVGQHPCRTTSCISFLLHQVQISFVSGSLRQRVKSSKYRHLIYPQVYHYAQHILLIFNECYNNTQSQFYKNFNRPITGY